jgi:predicted nucleotidyltransferase component of viral defense system
MAEVFTPIELFREALGFTRQRTGFPERLIEKDYVCTVLLELLNSAHDGLVFKGGTCLAKVHADFYRLSEDLDFVIPLPIDTPRSTRSSQAKGLKPLVAALPNRIPFVRVIEPLTGANNSTQYRAAIGYASAIGGREETIKIEVGLREPLMLSKVKGDAKTIVLDPVSGEPLVSTKTVRCIAKAEAFAEKFRAALSRREAAVRDFFDLDYAVRRLGLDPHDDRIIRLVRRKLAVPGNDPPDVSASRLAILRRQLDSELRSVLRDRDFREFDLERAFRLVADMADRVATRR